MANTPNASQPMTAVPGRADPNPQNDTSISAAEFDAPDGFYVPQFELRIAGKGLPGDVVRDVVEVTYTDKLEEIDSVEVTVNNWDAGTQAGDFMRSAQTKPRAKYVGSENLDTSGNPVGGATDPNAKYWTLFDPCKETVELYFGYAGTLQRIMTGTITTLEPSFPSSGAPTLQVRILNALHKLRRKKYDGSWAAPLPGGKRLTDTYIAKDIAAKKDDKLGNSPRIPIPLVTSDADQGDTSQEDSEPSLQYVIQKSQFDIDFLWRRAKINGYDLYVRKSAKDGTDELYFGPPAGVPGGMPVYRLEWGQSLIDLRATITTANQYRSVTVRGWNRATQQPIEKTVSIDDPAILKGKENVAYLAAQCDPREEFVSEIVVDNDKDAEKKARKILIEQVKGMVKISATTVGLPLLRTGSRIHLGQSVGSRLSGYYFVTATTHTFNNSGYTTRFEARLGGGAI